MTHGAAAWETLHFVTGHLQMFLWVMSMVVMKADWYFAFHKQGVALLLFCFILATIVNYFSRGGDRCPCFRHETRPVHLLQPSDFDFSPILLLFGFAVQITAMIMSVILAIISLTASTSSGGVQGAILWYAIMAFYKVCLTKLITKRMGFSPALTAAVALPIQCVEDFVGNILLVVNVEPFSANWFGTLWVVVSWELYRDTFFKGHVKKLRDKTHKIAGFVRRGRRVRGQRRTEVEDEAQTNNVIRKTSTQDSEWGDCVDLFLNTQNIMIEGGAAVFLVLLIIIDTIFVNMLGVYNVSPFGFPVAFGDRVKRLAAMLCLMSAEIFAGRLAYRVNLLQFFNRLLSSHQDYKHTQHDKDSISFPNCPAKSIPDDTTVDHDSPPIDVSVVPQATANSFTPAMDRSRGSESQSIEGNCIKKIESEEVPSRSTTMAGAPEESTTLSSSRYNRTLEDSSSLVKTRSESAPLGRDFQPGNPVRGERSSSMIVGSNDHAGRADVESISLSSLVAPRKISLDMSKSDQARLIRADIRWTPLLLLKFSLLTNPVERTPDAVAFRAEFNRFLLDHIGFYSKFLLCSALLIVLDVTYYINIEFNIQIGRQEDGGGQ